MKTIRHLHLVGATGQIRTATYDNREHLVVPVVAMVEGVVWAVNSDVPEFVPAEELAETPQQWNGRGCFAGHPADGGTQITANTPRTLEKSFGLVFDASGSDKILTTRRLELSAWIDPAKAEMLGRDAASVVRRLKAGEVVEVSVGCYVEAEDIDGEFNGKQYHGVWRNIVSDHLAFLAVGEQGACSVEAGCGAGRMATRHRVTHLKTLDPLNDVVILQVLDRQGVPLGPKVPVEEDMPDRPRQQPVAAAQLPQPPANTDLNAKRGFKERIASFLSSLRDSEVGVTDRELRYKVEAALRAVEPGFMGVDELYPDGTDDLATPHAIYGVMPADEWLTMRRSYTVADGVITLDAEAQHIEAVTKYEVVTAASAAKPCSCGGRQAHTHEPKPTEKEIVMKDTVKKVIAESGGKYTEADATWLDTVPDAHLDALAVKAAPVAEVPKAAAAKPMTEDEALVAFPRLGAIVKDVEAREKVQKTELITSLKTAQSAFTEAELSEKSISELMKLATLAKVETVDYSGNGVPRVPATKAVEDDLTPPSAYEAGLKTMRGETIQ